MLRRTTLTAAAAALLAAALSLTAPDAATAQEDGARLSPLDSVKATIQGAEIDVQYGRPSMRGRTIFGKLVPYGQVWRTGANEATHFRTSADLRIGDTRVPAGHYTLYTLPEKDAWTLVVNEQTGQWGTEYHPDRDVARIPLNVETLESAVDTFTMKVRSGREHDGRLILEWENTRGWAGIDVLQESGGGGPY